jgi:hypothetical protein
MDLIPEAYFEAINDDFDSSSERLKVAYRAIVDSTSDATRADIAHKFVEVLRDGDGGYVSGYSDAFFLAYDLDFVPKNHIAMVKDHVLDRSPKQHTKHSIEQLRGIEGHLEPTDAMRWFDPIIMTLTAKSVAHDVKVIVRNYCLDSFFSTRTDFDSALEIRIREWIEHYKKLNSVENMNFTIALKDEIEGRIIKF